MKKIVFVFLIAIAFLVMGCQLEPISEDRPNHQETTSEETTEETSTAETQNVYVAYNVNNSWHEELLTDDFDEGMVWYWNYISEGLRYWDKECTDPILGNDTNAVNSHSGRLYWSSELNRFIPYDER